jgi:hypothetical protein
MKIYLFPLIAPLVFLAGGIEVIGFHPTSLT